MGRNGRESFVEEIEIVPGKRAEFEGAVSETFRIFLRMNPAVSALSASISEARPDRAYRVG
jgi:hypothetical protein